MQNLLTMNDTRSVNDRTKCQMTVRRTKWQKHHRKQIFTRNILVTSFH